MQNPIKRKKLTLERASKLSEKIERKEYATKNGLRLETLVEGICYAPAPQGVMIKFSRSCEELSNTEIAFALERIYSRPTDSLDWIVDLSKLKHLSTSLLEALHTFQHKLKLESRKMHLIVPVATIERPEVLHQMVKQLKTSSAEENLK